MVNLKTTDNRDGPFPILLEGMFTLTAAAMAGMEGIVFVFSTGKVMEVMSRFFLPSLITEIPAIAWYRPSEAQSS